MRPAAIWAIMKLGRYAVLPVIAVVLVVAGYTANRALEKPGVISLSLAGALLVASMVSIALAIGLLFAGIRALSKIGQATATVFKRNGEGLKLALSVEGLADGLSALRQ